MSKLTLIRWDVKSIEALESRYNVFRDSGKTNATCSGNKIVGLIARGGKREVLKN